LAVSSISTGFQFTDTFATANASKSERSVKPGWAAGGGVEFGLTPHWTLRAEYLYVSLNTLTVNSSDLVAFGNIPFPTNQFTHKGDLASNIVRAAVNFKF